MLGYRNSPFAGGEYHKPVSIMRITCVYNGVNPKAGLSLSVLAYGGSLRLHENTVGLGVGMDDRPYKSVQLCSFNGFFKSAHLSVMSSSYMFPFRMNHRVDRAHGEY